MCFVGTPRALNNRLDTRYHLVFLIDRYRYELFDV